MSKHTSGPWKSLEIPGNLFEITSYETPVFRIRGGMFPTTADARLIAAAPEMLQALQYVLDGADGFQDGYSERGGHYTRNVCAYCGSGSEGCDPESCCVPIVRAAIEKAIGKP